MNDEYFMKQALREAEQARDEGEIPVGAVIVWNDRIIARAHNLTEKLRDVTAHAEMQAITAASGLMDGKYLTGCTLFVTLEPCIMCAGALAWSQISRIVYGASDPKKGFTSFEPSAIHPKTQVTSGVLEGESLKLLQQFFESKRR